MERLTPRSSVSSLSFVLSAYVSADMAYRVGSLLLSRFYPSILASSSCLFKSRAAVNVPEGISLPNMKSILLWVNTSAPSPRSDSSTAKQQQQWERAACWLTALRAHRIQVSHNCYFYPQHDVATGSRQKQGGLWELPESVTLCLVFFSRSWWQDQMQPFC